MESRPRTGELDDLLTDLSDLANNPTAYGQETHADLHRDVLAYLERQRAAVVEIARCAEHGLHGAQSECFVCGAPVEQVRLVPESP